MRVQKVLTAGAVVVALGAVLLADGAAADEKDVRVALDKLVTTAAKKPDDLRKEAAKFVADAKVAGEDTDSFKPVMDLLGRRDPKEKVTGWGVGAKPGAITPDNIDLKLKALVRDKPALTREQLAKEAEALVEMAHRTAAVGAVALAAAPKKKLPDKDPKDWKEAAEEMITASQELARAAGGDKPDLEKVKKAAGKLNAACSNCHGKFRD
jgi:hypothetical protein